MFTVQVAVYVEPEPAINVVEVHDVGPLPDGVGAITQDSLSVGAGAVDGTVNVAE